ncbi:hypothetical protein JQK15_20615 [Sphingobium sp. BHU LFT2]|uniref:hypothetical protein n=1 Tax=Sphingobium sp. BHU LFT2 TaxID=2807634 RepID=UPI001BE80AEA|nr:hypothetical protein [Sphingobium sp. BHU LFT2]MBT2245919.1 hypothetical protein [Sphingobium sp. BHU LFT2]
MIRIIRGCLVDDAARAEAAAEIVAVGGDERSRIGIAALCALLARTGIEVRRPGSAWLSIDELRLLAWLAYAPRETAMDDYLTFGLTIDADAAAELRIELATCGRELARIGCRLPALAWTNDFARPLYARGRR